MKSFIHNFADCDPNLDDDSDDVYLDTFCKTEKKIEVDFLYNSDKIDEYEKHNNY